MAAFVEADVRPIAAARCEPLSAREMPTLNGHVPSRASGLESAPEERLELSTSGRAPTTILNGKAGRTATAGLTALRFAKSAVDPSRSSRRH